MKIIVCCFFLALLFGFTTKTPTPQSPVIVELFTSQGCSSCPAADRLLGDIVENSDNILGLSFHVSYWNHLGWKDPYSSEQFNARQKEYASTLNLSSIYTPQMIVNGTTEFVGSDKISLANAIKKATTEVFLYSIEATAVSQSRQFTIHYSLDKVPADITLSVALVENFVQNAVPSGENSGRVLKHHNVVRTFVSQKAEHTGDAILLAPTEMNLQHARIILFLQDEHLKVVGATSIKPGE